MRVAMVSEHASPLAALGGADAGGQNVYVGALASELLRQGHEVVVHTRRDDANLPPRVCTANGVVVDHVDAGPPVQIPKDDLWPLMDQFAAVLSEQWAEKRPDVVHAHFWMSGVASVLAARPLGIPVVLTFHAIGSVKRRHQGEADTSPADRVDVERWLLGEVDHVVATCRDEVEELNRLGTLPRAISVVPCGVDLDLFRPDGTGVAAAARRNGGGHRVATIGRLVERKGVADAVEALRWLPDTELLVAGGPPPDGIATDPEVRRLSEVAVRAGTRDRVRFLGQVSRADMPALLRSVEAVVSVPYYEPFGMVPLEAMACGTPPVVSAVGGLRESVVDGQTGLHVPPGDPLSLAESLSLLFGDECLARRLGAAGVRRARSVYGWPRIATRIADVYTRSIAADPVTSFSGTQAQ